MCPNEFDDAFQQLHQVAIPHMGLFIGEMWGFEELAADCADDGRYEFFVAAAPIPFTGAGGGPGQPTCPEMTGQRPGIWPRGTRHHSCDDHEPLAAERRAVQDLVDRGDDHVG